MHMAWRTVHTEAVPRNATTTRHDLPAAACPCAAEDATNALHAVQQNIPTSKHARPTMAGMGVIFSSFFFPNGGKN